MTDSAAAALTLRLPTTADEADVRALNSSCSTDTFDFLAGAGALSAERTDSADYTAFLDSVRNQHEGTNLPDGWLPADFLLAEITTDGGGTALIGRRGYATEILRQSLALLAERGIGKALITCDEDNAGSIGVIEANGGILDDRRTNPDGTLIRRYWIELSPEPVTR